MHPTSVSLQRLFDVRSSLPVPRKCCVPTWGHDFGGALVAYKTTHFLGEDVYEVLEYTNLDLVFSKNPYQVTGVNHPLAEGPQQPAAVMQHAPPPWGLVLDCFVSMPGELCVAIAMFLPTVDASCALGVVGILVRFL